VENRTVLAPRWGHSIPNIPSLVLPLDHDPDADGALDDLVTQVQTATDPNAGRIIAKRCGCSIRRELGFPRFTAANQQVVSQRVERWLRDNAAGLRQSQWASVHARAVMHALCPSSTELGMVEYMQSVDVMAREHYMHSVHMIPANLYEPEGGLIPSRVNF